MFKKITGGCLVALLGVFFMAGQADALEIYQLDGSGGKTLVKTNGWAINSGSPVSGTTLTDINGDGSDWKILVGANSFGAPEGGSQTSAIYGAGIMLPGAFGYEVVFDFDGYTWDSYNKTVATGQGAHDGYWDLFAVNINQQGYYWDLVNGGTGGAGDPLMSTDPAGTPVYDPDGTGNLAGATWGWGGLDYAAGYFEEEHGTYTISLEGDNGNGYYISAVLDTATDPNSDTQYPSWGGFNAKGSVDKPDGGQSQDVPEPSTLLLLGAGLLGYGLRRNRAEA